MSRSVQRFVDVSGLRKVAQGFEWVGKAAMGVLRTMVEIVPVLGTITGAATLAGMAKLVGSYAAWSHQLTATADGIGMTTQQLQHFEDAMRLAGGNTADMDEALKGLYKTATDFMTGKASGDTVGWLNRLGINVKDATGHMRTMADMMPEAIDKITKIENPATRAAAATALMGEAGIKLVESFRQSSRGFAGFFRDAERYTAVTDAQRRALQLFTEAQARVSTAFDSLGQQISATVAKNFTPLLTHLSEFVEKHTPEIITAIDQISTKFAAWLDGITWTNVEAGLQSVMDSFTWLIDHLDEIKTVAETIAILFATKWAVGMVASIATVVTALGPVTVALGAIAALIATFEANKAGQGDIEKKAKALGFDKVEGGPLSLPSFRNPTTGENLSYGEMMQRQGKPSGGGGFIERFIDRALKGPASIQQQGGGPTAPLAPGAQKSAFYDEQRQLIYDAAVKANVPHPEVLAEVGATQAQLESGGGQHTPTGAGGFNVYGIKSGGGVGGVGAPVSTQEEGSGGRYTTQASFATFQNKQDAAAAYVDFLKKNPRHYGRVLAAATVDEGLKAQGESGYATASNYSTSLSATQRKYGGAQGGAPAVPPPPGGRINGAVDVSITHKNPPPDSAVTAKGSGQVNVAPPRVEHQEFASI